MFFYNQHFLSGIVTLVFSLAFIFGISKDMLCLFFFKNPPGMHNCRLRICVISQLLLAPQLNLIFFLACLIKKKKKKDRLQRDKQNKKTQHQMTLQMDSHGYTSLLTFNVL